MADRELKSVSKAIEDLYEDFPRLSDGSPLFRYWGICEMHFEKVCELANAWRRLARQPSPETAHYCGGLFKIYAWYLYELGRYDDALQLLHVAFEATLVTISGRYVPLCDIAAAIYYEQNNLESCQKFNEKSQRSRQASEGGDFSERMFHYQNFGNLAAAQGNFTKALKYYEDSLDQLKCKLKYKERQYHDNGMILEIYCMMTGHIYFLNGDDGKAIEHYREAVRVLQPYENEAAPLYARSLYAAGNWMYKNIKEDQKEARQYYTLGHKLSQKGFPKGTTHILTAMFDYKLGMLEADSNNFMKALDHLEDARQVAKNNKAPGHVARILRQQALLFRAKAERDKDHLWEAEDVTDLAKEDLPSRQQLLNYADELMEDAEAIRARLVGPEAAQGLSDLSENKAYDRLVCPFFR